MDETKEYKERGRKPSAPREGRPARRSRSTESMVKKSIVLPPSTAAAAEELATAEGISLSALMTRAVDELTARVSEDLRRRRLSDELLADYEAEHGPIPQEEWDRADAFLKELDEYYATDPE